MDAYLQTPAGRVAKMRASRKWESENTDKRRAATMVGNAIRDGRLERQPCEVCGASKVDAHHDDYTQPLHVRWLCRQHHAEWHVGVREFCRTWAA